MREFLSRLTGRFRGTDATARGRNLLSAASLASFAVPLVLAPIWSRVYPLEYFAIAALVQILPGLLTGWSTLAYHTAIHTPREDQDAFTLVCLSLCLLCLSTLLLLGACALGREWLGVHLLKQAGLGSWLWFSPVLLFATTTTMIMDYWMARRQCFSELARAMTLQSVISPIVPALGLWSPQSTNFVLLGAVGSAVLGCGLRLQGSGFIGRLRLSAPSVSQMWAVALRFINFPRDVLPSHVLTSFSTQLPQINMARQFGTETVGHFARVGTLLLLPLTVFCKPFMIVFAQEAGRAYREQGNCRPVFLRTLGKLFLLMTPIYAMLALTAPWLYPWFYGATWKEAGLLAQPMAVFYWAAAVCSPLADVMNFGRNTKWDVAWQALRLPVVALSLWWGSRMGGVLGALWTLSIANVLLYGIYLMMSYHLAVRRD